MSECCNTEKSVPVYPKRYRCPFNQQEYKAVSRKTVLQHANKPWQLSLPEQGYYFCTDPECDVVYFGEDDRVLIRNNLRTDVGQKSTGNTRTICYCFGVSLQQAQADATVKEFVVEQTRQHMCDCENRNPSGRCCLNDFPKQ